MEELEKYKKMIVDNARKYRARRLLAESAMLAMLESLTLGKAKAFAVVWIEHTISKRRAKKSLMPVRAAFELNESYEKTDTPIRVMTDKTFYAFEVPLEYDADSEVQRQIDKILAEIKKLANLAEE